MTDDQAIAQIIASEGGANYTDDPDDAGGPTKYGITLDTLKAWRGEEVTAEDVKNLGEQEARDIYREKYLNEPGIAKIGNVALRHLVLDAAVNQGPASAIKMLQRALNLTDDGLIGPNTLSALPLIDARRVGMRFLHQRALAYVRLVQAKPGQAKFLGGWINRVFAQAEGLFG